MPQTFKIFVIEFCKYVTLFHTPKSKYSPQNTVIFDILTLRSPHGRRNRDLHPHETTIQSALKLNSTSLTIPRHPTGRVRQNLQQVGMKIEWILHASPSVPLCHSQVFTICGLGAGGETEIEIETCSPTRFNNKPSPQHLSPSRYYANSIKSRVRKFQFSENVLELILYSTINFKMNSLRYV